MAELTPRERLQPSLLDRLTDEEPHKRQESRERRVLSMRVLRQGVLRDLSWLLNTTALSSLQDVTAFPLAARSTINFGLPDMTGKTASGMNLGDVAREIREAVCRFEPRILPHTLSVRAVSAGGESHNSVVFELEGELWAQPVAERLFLRTELDLEVGAIRIADLEAR